MSKDELVSLVRKRYNIAVNIQGDKFKKFNDFDYIYNNKLQHYDPNIPARVFNPILWSFIETIITRMLAKSPTVGYKPRNVDDQQQSDIFSQMFSYWFDKTKAYTKVVEWVKNALIYGTGVAKIDWFTSKPREVKSYVLDATGTPALDDQGNFITNTTTVIDYDDPRLTVVNIYDFFIDPMARDIDDAKWLIHQYWVNISDLEQENDSAEKLGKRVYSKYALDKIKRERNSNYNQYEENRKQATGITTPTTDETVDRCLIWEMWEDNKLYVIADGMTVIREEDNPYWHGKKPFIRLVDSIVPKEFWGKGEIEPAEGLLHALNTTQNQRITNINRILGPLWKAKPNVNDDELNFVDNGIIHVNDLQDAEIVPMPDVTSKAYQEGDAIKNDIQRTLGVTDLVQGLDTPAQTAQEVQIKTSQSNARFANKILLFEEMALKEVGEIVYQLYQQYVTSEKVVKVSGTEGDSYIKVTPADLVGEYDVIPESSSTLAVDNEAEFNKSLNLFSILRAYTVKQIPTPMGMQTTGFLNEEELVKDLINKSGEKNTDRFFVKPNVPEGVQNGQTGIGQPPDGQNQLLPPVAPNVPNPGMAGIR